MIIPARPAGWAAATRPSPSSQRRPASTTALSQHGRAPPADERWVSAAVVCTAGGPTIYAPLFGGVWERRVSALRTDADDEPARPGLWRWRRAAHVEVVHHLAQRVVRVVGELHGAGDGGVSAERAGGQAVQQQRHPRVAQHVRRLAPARDRAEENVVTIGFDEDYRHLR